MKANNQTTRMASLQMAWFFIFFLLAKSAFAFSVGAIAGVSCGFGKPINCNIATYLSNNVYEEVHQHITKEALDRVIFSGIVSNDVTFSAASIIEIQDANAYTDKDQSPEKHCDNEEIGFCEGRLFSGYQLLKGSLANKSTMTQTLASQMRYLFGQHIHTLQDFFSHSNWVNISPSPTDIPPWLWDGSQPQLPVLPSSVYSPCGDARTASVSIPNTPPTSGILSLQGQSGGITSGYALLPLENAIAPGGKCAHGLLSTQEYNFLPGFIQNKVRAVPVSGIHKDWSSRPLHGLAHDQAVYATEMFTLDIINDKNNNLDNVCMFMTDKTCPTPTPSPRPSSAPSPTPSPTPLWTQDSASCSNNIYTDSTAGYYDYCVVGSGTANLPAGATISPYSYTSITACGGADFVNGTCVNQTSQPVIVTVNFFSDIAYASCIGCNPGLDGRLNVAGTMFSVGTSSCTVKAPPYFTAKQPCP